MASDPPHPSKNPRSPAKRPPKPGVGAAEAGALPPLVVGIGASAGGIEAFKSFFEKMPAETGMAFVLVQHLDPSHKSALAAIVGSYTEMPVHIADDGVPIGANQIYIIPPDATLTISGGRLRLTRPAPPAVRRTSINTFLISLAQDQGENAIGIILSGFGNDGALGVAAIKEHGGLTLSQAESDHHAMSGMPQSAASSGFVDHVLAVGDMPAALLNYQRHRKTSDIGKGPDGVRHDLPGNLVAICDVVHSRLGRDFSEYKPGTLMRRVQRRMQVLQVADVASYVERLRALPDEAGLLFREFLIGVTRFFRDPQAFAALDATVLSKLVAEAHAAEPIRVWVAGCATGEEAYSIAILLKESLVRAGRRHPVQIFATDIDDRAIDVARAGIYPGAIAADVSPERLDRYFIKKDGVYRVGKDIREMCLFSVHDLTRDPPFSRLDLISCRNLMIYFEPRLQQRIIATFHYALRPGRILFLGPSESATAQARLFAPVDKRHRLLARRDAVVTLPAVAVTRSTEVAIPGARHVPVDVADDIDRRATRAMAPYAPAFLVVDRRHEILRFSGPTARYIAPAPGVASLNLFSLLHPDLRPAVRAALKRCAETGGRVTQGTFSLGVHGPLDLFNLIVEPLANPKGDDLFVVVFHSVGRARNETPDEGPASDGGDAAVQVLSAELLAAREELRNTRDELEAAHAESQSSNEEYLSINEELQSSNEELETAKEEMQSLNEELQTVNSELANRNEGLVRANSDLLNLLSSTSIATLFLDNDLRIRRFTPRVLDIFKLRDGDEGRPIGDIVSGLARDGPAQDVKQVLRTLMPIEREVAMTDGRTSYLMQVRPYRDLNDVVDGAVVTFVDITERKLHEQARSLLAAIVDSSEDAIMSHDLRGTIVSWNGGAERLFGRTADEAIGQAGSAFLRGTRTDDWSRVQAGLVNGDRIAHFDTFRTGKGGERIDMSCTVSPVKDGGGRVVGASVVARDITERRAAEQKNALLLGELDHRVKNILALVSAVISQTLRAGLTPKEFATAMHGRIQSIAKAHSLLTAAGHGDVSLRTLIESELAPYDRKGEARLTISGADVALTPKAGIPMAMAIHELASNAAKYGALSEAAGRLDVRWSTADGQDGESLVLSWVEAGGPPVHAPTRRGFGTTLIEHSLAHEFDAVVHREFPASGVRCTITIPLTEDFSRSSINRLAGDG